MNKYRAFLITLVISFGFVNLSGCSLVRMILHAVGTHHSSDSGVRVENNKLHAGPKTTTNAITDYTNVGQVTNHYKYHTSDYIIVGIVIAGVFWLFTFMIWRFLRFIRGILEMNRKK